MVDDLFVDVDAASQSELDDHCPHCSLIAVVRYHRLSMAFKNVLSCFVYATEVKNYFDGLGFTVNKF